MNVRIMADSPIRFPGLFGDWAFTGSSVAFHIGGKAIYWYGIIIALGVLLALWFCMKQKEKYGITEDNLMDGVLWGIPLAIVGARLYYVLFYLDRFKKADGSFDWAESVAIWDGGLAIYGGVIAAVLASAVAGLLYSSLLAFSAINLKADQTIGGTALNLMAPALVLFFIRIIANQNTLQMLTGDAASWFMIKKSTLGIDKNTDLGFFGETFVNKVYLATYVCILLFIILSILLYKTRFGLRLRACGENPQAADSLGINVYKMRYAGTTISGALAGMGGFVYALTTANCASNGDVAGFGFLALAVMIFGNWKPVNIAVSSLLFGLFKCIAASYASIDINGDGIFKLAEIGISAHLYRMLPYIVTLLVLAFTSKSSRAPKAEGIPYDKGPVSYTHLTLPTN